MSEDKKEIKWEEVADVDTLKLYLIQIFGEDNLYDELWQDAIPAMHENKKKLNLKKNKMPDQPLCQLKHKKRNK
jgi:hypothetical protein